MRVARRAFALVRWLVVLEIGIWRSLFLDGRHEIAEVRFYVDDSRAFVAAARERLADRRPAERVTA